MCTLSHPLLLQGADKGGGLKDLIAERTGRPEGKISAAGKGKRSADAAYLDLCRYLEEENGRLQRAVEGGQEELERSRADAAAAALIPQYRLAIVRWDSEILYIKHVYINGI